jgi:hypothetical protein
MLPRSVTVLPRGSARALAMAMGPACAGLANGMHASTAATSHGLGLRNDCDASDMLRPPSREPCDDLAGWRYLIIGRP